jgi:unsaturated rhamnogalacturonyl hydrolase
VRVSSAILRLLLAFAVVFPMAAANRYAIGLTHNGTRIQANEVPGASAGSPTVLLIGGLDQGDDSVRVVEHEVQYYEKIKEKKRPFRLLAIPLANPDHSRLMFPPTGVAYRENPESNALWRWIGLQAPDFVLIAGSQYSGLADALSNHAVADVGRIPARIVAVQEGILKELGKKIQIPPSEAHQEIERRRARSPRQLADELAQFYGHDFNQVIYINSLALIAQIRLGHIADVQKLVEPYVNGSKDSLARPNSLVLAGHLVFAELAKRTHDPRYTALVKKVADLGFTASGEMKESMPYHNEMSDSVFMATPIVTEAGKLTGEGKYFDLAARHQAFMENLDLRSDGLYRHSPLTDAAWGRGNAFPALGLALTLTDFPKDHPQYGHILLAYQQLMAALSKYQDQDGMWREVIDQPGSYSEFSATAMIGFAMLRGIREGWLDKAAYQPKVDAAWRAILARVGPQGELVDVCESTNKQKTLQDYLDRAAILGKDARGGAMALMFATEMAGLP